MSIEFCIHVLKYVTFLLNVSLLFLFKNSARYWNSIISCLFLKMHIKTRYDSINVEWLSFAFCKLYSKCSNIYIILYLEHLYYFVFRILYYWLYSFIFRILHVKHSNQMLSLFRHFRFSLKVMVQLWSSTKAIW